MGISPRPNGTVGVKIWDSHARKQVWVGSYPTEFEARQAERDATARLVLGIEDPPEVTGTRHWVKAEPSSPTNGPDFGSRSTAQVVGVLAMESPARGSEAGHATRFL